jgi:hypothetical protein
MVTTSSRHSRRSVTPSGPPGQQAIELYPRCRMCGMRLEHAWWQDTDGHAYCCAGCPYCDCLERSGQPPMAGYPWQHITSQRAS